MLHDHLGQLLLNESLIDEPTLSDALATQKRAGGRLGDILATSIHLSPLKLYQTLAKQKKTPFVNLQLAPCDDALLDFDELDYYLQHQMLPWKQDGKTYTIVCTELTEDNKRWAHKRYGPEIIFVMTTPRDIRHMLEQTFGKSIDYETRTKLLKTMPHYSAFNTVLPTQRRFILLLCATILAALLAFPVQSAIAIIVALNIFYICTIGLKFLLYKQKSKVKRDYTEEALTLNEQSLPVYSILVPMYKEADSVDHLLDAMRALDYPKNKLDVKLVVEADDKETIDAIIATQPEPYFDLIRVPYSQPRTKPKACNYALTFAKGDFITIYDAEDRPDPMQLKKAIAAFRAAPDNVVCLQARLNYYNRPENMLSKLFAIEYASLFDIMLPGLQGLNIPIPLGGTSNHIYLKRLREVGDWDPYNVTEDADLGMRLALEGYKTQVLDSVTMEEAPITLKAWISQRSRWIKGYLQTWLVYMRQPSMLYRTLDRRGFWGFQFFIGGPCIVFLLAPIMWLLCAAWAASLIPSPMLPTWLLVMCIAVFAGGILCNLWYAAVVVKQWQWKGMALAVLLFPFYWFLHSFASFKALWQLIKKPHFWEKTSHGITRMRQMTVSPSPATP